MPGPSVYGIVGLRPGDEKRTSTTKGPYMLGQLAVTPDGRFFRYAFSGEALPAGQLLMQSIGQALYDMDVAVNAAAVGDKSVSLNNTSASTVAAAADLYEDGYLYVNDGGGEGHTYLIERHLAHTTDGTDWVIHLKDSDPIDEALVAATSLVGLMKNPYKDVEVWDVSDIDGAPLGVSNAEVADNEYFWMLVEGPQATLINTGSSAVPILGQAVIAGTTDAVDGAVEKQPHTNSSVTHANLSKPVIGEAMLIAAVTTDYGMIKVRRL